MPGVGGDLQQLREAVVAEPEGLRQRCRREVARLPAQGADVAVARLPQCFQEPRFAEEAAGEPPRRREADHLATEEILDDGRLQSTSSRRTAAGSSRMASMFSWVEAVGLQIEEVVIEDRPQPRTPRPRRAGRR